MRAESRGVRAASRELRRESRELRTESRDLRAERREPGYEMGASERSVLRPADVRTPWVLFWLKFRRQRVAVVAGIFVLGLVALAVVSPLIVPFDPEKFFDYDALNAGPSVKHWFGVDALGRDIFSRIVAGTRISLAAGFISVFVGAIIGTLLGLIAGYMEGWYDRVVMRVCDVLFAFPGILLAIGIVAILGSGMANVIIAVSIFSIPTFARLARGNTLAIKHLTYVEAARSVGAPTWVILLRHADRQAGPR